MVYLEEKQTSPSYSYAADVAVTTDPMRDIEQEDGKCKIIAYTIFLQSNAAATINFRFPEVQPQFEGSYSCHDAHLS